jgi:hypothetical protein
VRCRVDRRPLHARDGVARQRVEARDPLDLVTPQLDADALLLVRREHLHHVAAHAERAALEAGVIARVLHAHQRLQDVAPLHLLPVSSTSISSRYSRGSPRP